MPMPPETHRLRRQNRGFLGHDSSALSTQDAQDRHQLRYELDLNSWNLRIWGVAASGFLTDSYNLFATNVILTSINFVYWPEGEAYAGLLINIFTLLGSVVGQLTFGFLADYYGRTRLYGIELVLVIASTIGVATASRGYGDMTFLGLFIWWRFVMGIGIGAEYPLSAVITSEWSSTNSRATMLSSVFLMQPIGQCLAQLVGLWVLLGFEDSKHLQAMRCGLDTLHDDECRTAVDGIWRIVVGSGAIPALAAIVFRFFLFDCGLYSLEVRNKPTEAIINTQRVYGTPSNMPNGFQMQQQNGGVHQEASPRPMPVQFSKEDLYLYFVTEGNWYYLLGTAATWFVLDVSFYGLSLDNRGTVADMWATRGPVPLNDDLSCWDSSLEGGNSTVPEWAENGLPSWQTDASHPCHSIYDVLLDQAYQYILTVSIASIAGSVCFITFANRIPRRLWLTVSFLVLTLLFIITGGVYYGVHQSDGAPATVALVAVCHFMFNFGANTLTFIIPAEIFPTCYRCTSHGISAASGKLGSIVAVLVVYGINEAYEAETRQGLIFILFGSVAAFGAVFSWAYLPDPQRWVDDDLGSGGKGFLETKDLEELGEGRERARQGGEVITFKEKFADVRRRRTMAQTRLASAGSGA